MGTHTAPTSHWVEADDACWHANNMHGFLPYFKSSYISREQGSITFSSPFLHKLKIQSTLHMKEEAGGESERPTRL